MIKEQIITKINEIQGMLAKIAVLDLVVSEGGADNQKPKLKETKSYGKRRKIYKAKGDLTAAARELATQELIDTSKASAYVGFARMEAGVESRVMKLMRQQEVGDIEIGQLEFGLKKELGVAYKEAYVFGQRSIGYSGDLMDEDLAFIKSFKKTENGFLRKFMKAIVAEKLVMDRYERAKMYVDTVRTVFDHARVEAAPNWIKIYWVPSRSVKHCADCLVLAVNSPYSKKSLPTTPRAGDTSCLSNCKCHLMMRYKKPDDIEPVPEGIKPPGEEYKVHPDLYDKFKGDVPEFRFFMDLNTGNPKAARKEFVAAVKKSGVGFTPSNYDDPFNRKFLKSNKIWFDVQKIKEIERSIPAASAEGVKLLKKRQELMKDLLSVNTKLRKDGLRWIRPDGYGGYKVGPDGVPFTLLPKG
ncbi:MAG: hypothetical protein KAV87_15700 [Desulfobacteraceae bacterium]|nr:hypothetical protein [Desulfobacteraceae bacterium]